MKFVRLDKYLADMGIGTRSQIKEMAKKGRISVDGMLEKKTDLKIDSVQNKVFVDGQQISYLEYEYYMLNKPQGVVSATRDSRHKTVMDLITEHKRKDLFPVGRLDIDTEGFLLITNDGELAHELLAPKKHVDKTYFARIEGKIPSDAKERMEEGLILSDGTPALPARLEVWKHGTEGELSEILLTIQEGKFHQVKRMFETLGCFVVFLKRITMGKLSLDESLKPGQYRPLSEVEIKILKSHGKGEKTEDVK